jgi:TusA-related sulfurtransferase
MTKPEKIFLDARELEHPIPLERAIHALRELDEHNYFYMIHRKNPIPLIDLAKEQRFYVLNKEDSQGVWHILITRSGTLDLERLCDV